MYLEVIACIVCFFLGLMIGGLASRAADLQEIKKRLGMVVRDAVDGLRDDQTISMSLHIGKYKCDDDDDFGDGEEKLDPKISYDFRRN